MLSRKLCGTGDVAPDMVILQTLSAVWLPFSMYSSASHFQVALVLIRRVNIIGNRGFCRYLLLESRLLGKKSFRSLGNLGRCNYRDILHPIWLTVKIF